MWTRSVVLSCALSTGCDLGGQVAHDGKYGFLEPAGLPSTGARPLERLLVVEADGEAERTLYYFFEGDLGEAGIGLEDLRGIAARFSRFELRFTTPRESYQLPSPSADLGDAPSLSVDGEPVTLSELIGDELAATGASRFAGALGSARAYLGVRASAADFAELELRSTEGRLVYAPELAASRATVERTAEGLRVDYGRLRRPDYVEVDFFQRVLREADQVALEASLRVELWPEWPALAGNAALESALSHLCWLAEAPLAVRVTQNARAYYAGEGGDAAVVARRLDVGASDPAEWSAGLAPTSPAAYCEGFVVDRASSP
jgi:hypothetical protein